jgi:uncharacterized membrane protein YeiH
MPATFELPIYFDYGATFLWAVSGALLAARRGYDPVGIFAIALVSATGGGLIRDGLFLQDTPLVVRRPHYIAIVGAAALIVVLAGRYVRRLRVFEETVALVDALGLGAYAVVGVQMTVAKGLGYFAPVLVGVLNAVGGSLLRDVLMRQEPDIFKPGRLSATAALVGCIVFLFISRAPGLGADQAAWITIGLVFVIRLMSVRFGWYTRPVAGIYEPAGPRGGLPRER